MTTTAEPPAPPEAEGTEQSTETRVPLIKALRDALKESPKDDTVLLPRELVEQVVGWLFRLPDSKEKTVTRPFNQKHRHLIRVALATHQEALTKEAKKLEALGYLDLSDKLTADAGAIDAKIRPEFNEQAELPLVDPRPTAEALAQASKEPEPAGT